MRLMGLCGAVLLAVGCSTGVTKKDLDVVKQQMVANDNAQAAALRKDLAEMERRYARVQQLEQQIDKKLKNLEQLEQQVLALSTRIEGRSERAYTTALKVLEFEERLMSERLATLRALIGDLKKE